MRWESCSLSLVPMLRGDYVSCVNVLYMDEYTENHHENPIRDCVYQYILRNIALAVNIPEKYSHEKIAPGLGSHDAVCQVVRPRGARLNFRFESCGARGRRSSRARPGSRRFIPPPSLHELRGLRRHRVPAYLARHHPVRRV